MEQKRLAIIGLGYVGLPLAVEFGKKYPTVGFDINQERIQQLSLSIDRTLESNEAEIKSSTHLTFTNQLQDIQACQIYVVTVPTPIDQFKAPDLIPLKKASAILGKVLKKGDIVIYESTVYPGCTEEECVPVLEK